MVLVILLILSKPLSRAGKINNLFFLILPYIHLYLVMFTCIYLLPEEIEALQRCTVEAETIPSPGCWQWLAKGACPCKGAEVPNTGDAD
jgi:hypothetical protein